MSVTKLPTVSVNEEVSLVKPLVCVVVFVVVVCVRPPAGFRVTTLLELELEVSVVRGTNS